MTVSHSLRDAFVFCASIASFTPPGITQVEGLRLPERDPVPSDEWALDQEGGPDMYVFDPEGRDMIPFTEHSERKSGASKIDYLNMGPLVGGEGYDDVRGGICPAGKLVSWSKDFQDVGCDFADWDSRYDVNSLADTSLPWLHDVFIDSMQQTVRFVLSNRKQCFKGCACDDRKSEKDGVRCKKALPCSTAACEKLSPQDFNFFDNTFTCEFSNGDVVESQKTQRMGTIGSDWALLVQCPLPVRLQNRTDARVNLVAPSLEDGRVRKLVGLPLCSSMARRNVHHYSISGSSKGSLATISDSKALAPLSHKQFDLGVCLWLTADQHMFNKKNTSALWRLEEWLRHHDDVGVGHFFVYDNSEQPSIEMAQILEPFVKSGRASLVHWPQRACRTHHSCAQDYSGWLEDPSNFDKEIGYGCHPKEGFYIPPIASSQFTMDLSCLQRFGEFTKSMAFIDVDEFLVPRRPHKSVQSALAEAGAGADGWRPAPTLARKCSTFKDVPSEGHVRSHFQCTSDAGPKSTQKIIVNPDRVMIHQVHFGVYTWNMTKPTIQDVPGEKLMMVHAREEDPIESWEASEQMADAMRQFVRPA